MEDLAPDITRQRLLIEGYFERDVDATVISEYMHGLPAALDLRTYGEPTVFAPGGEGRAENEGYDAFIPLIDSGISLYVWTGPRFLSVVVFTCKAFDEATALEFTRTYFRMSRTAHRGF